MSGDYWQRVRDEAGRLGSDGCTLASGAYKDCCFEHDIAYRTGALVDGECLTKREADVRLRCCIQSHSRFGWYSPVAWGRFWIVTLVGHFAWNSYAKVRAEAQRRRDAFGQEEGIE